MPRSRWLTAGPQARDRFRPRGRDVTRLEAFSDCVFAFAVTLAIVALEVPKSLEQLFAVMKGFPVFGVCFAVLLNIWWVHHRFFRRYGIADLPVFLLNGLLLFVVLFFIYPLRFIFGQFFGTDAHVSVGVSQARDMFTIYGLGFAAVYAVLALMHVHAWRLRERLELNEIERWMTVETIAYESVLACVGLLSFAVARVVEPQRMALAGWIYFVIPIPMTLVGTWFGKKLDKLERARDTPSFSARGEPGSD